MTAQKKKKKEIKKKNKDFFQRKQDTIVWQAKISLLSWLFADCSEFLFQWPRSVLAHYGIF